MPITKSAKKALRQNKKRRKANLIWNKKIKETENKIKKLIEDKKLEEAKRNLPTYYKIVDKAAKNNVIKKNTSSRKKSKLARVILKGEKPLSKENTKKK